MARISVLHGAPRIRRMIDPGPFGTRPSRAVAAVLGRERLRAGPVPSVAVLAQSFEGHCEQVYTGLSMLATDGRINLRVRALSPDEFITSGEPERLWQWHVPAVVDGVKVMFDVHDDGSVERAAASWADVVLKRSHDPSVALPHQHPLGLNMEIYRDGPDRFVLARMPVTFATRRQIRYLATGLGVWQRRRWRPTVGYFDGHRARPRSGTVVFATRTWEPPDSLTPAIANDWHRRNAFRADLVRAIRAHFGDRAWAAMSPTDYAREHFGDCVPKCHSEMDQPAYLRRVLDAEAVVTTEGLFSSTGWRFAEALALGAAIVSEPNRYKPAVPVQPEQHYLAARTIDDFLMSIELLLTDPGIGAAMRESNRVYWRSALRPDELVWRGLETALGARR